MCDQLLERACKESAPILVPDTTVIRDPRGFMTDALALESLLRYGLLLDLGERKGATAIDGAIPGLSTLHNAPNSYLD